MKRNNIVHIISSSKLLEEEYTHFSESNMNIDLILKLFCTLAFLKHLNQGTCETGSNI